jgi:hypothetical protein
MKDNFLSRSATISFWRNGSNNGRISKHEHKKNQYTVIYFQEVRVAQSV